MTVRLILAAALVAMIVGIYGVGYLQGRRSIEAKLAADNIEILKDGKKIDENVLQADDSVLCRMLGGCVQPDRN